MENQTINNYEVEKSDAPVQLPDASVQLPLIKQAKMTQKIQSEMGKQTVNKPYSSSQQPMTDYTAKQAKKPQKMEHQKHKETNNSGSVQMKNKFSGMMLRSHVKLLEKNMQLRSFPKVEFKHLD